MVGERRDEILDVAEEIEKTWRKNEPDKGDSWKNMTITQLNDKLSEEYKEYTDAIFQMEKGLVKPEDAAKEIIDQMVVLTMLYKTLVS